MMKHLLWIPYAVAVIFGMVVIIIRVPVLMLKDGMDWLTKEIVKVCNEIERKLGI